MSIINKLSGLVTIGSAVAGAALAPRLLKDVMIIVAFTIVGSVISGLLIGAGLYGVYLVLVLYGVVDLLAASVVAGLALLIVLLLVFGAVARMQRLRNTPGRLLSQGEHALSSGIAGIAGSFMDGLKAAADEARR